MVDNKILGTIIRCPWCTCKGTPICSTCRHTGLVKSASKIKGIIDIIIDKKEIK